MKNILVPIDFSESSTVAITEAAVLAGATGARLVLLHVIEPISGVTPELGFIAGPAIASDALAADAKRSLQRLRRELSGAGLRVSVLHAHGPVGNLIVRYAAQLHAVYIVMGSRGHGALHDLIVGSTTRHVLKRATCPVVVVPPGDHRRRLTEVSHRSAPRPARARIALPARASHLREASASAKWLGGSSLWLARCP